MWRSFCRARCLLTRSCMTFWAVLRRAMRGHRWLICVVGVVFQSRALKTASWSGCRLGGEEGPVWDVLAGVGARFDNLRCALTAKAELLALVAGLVHHSELRVGAPPYSLNRLISQGASPGDKCRCAESFLRTPEHCLSECCRCLRPRCPTTDTSLRHGRGIIEAWAEGSILDIGRIDRSHGLMRQDLRSEHRARSFTRSANHSLCQ